VTDPLLSSYAFNHPKYERERAGVRFFAAKRATVLVGGGRPPRFGKVCQITFHRGAVFVQFTYFGPATGLAAVLLPVQDPNGTWKMDLGATGLVAPGLVKYSHPPDGNAHFSQDGKIVSVLRRQSFPLTTGQGHLFQLSAFHPTRFESLEPGTERPNRLYAPFYFPEQVPDAIGVAAMWWPFDRLVGLKPADRPLGPLETMVNYRTRANFKAFYVAPPDPDPPTHALLVNVGPIPLPPGVAEPQLIFLGGWDHDIETKPEPGECLTFMYPITDPAKWEERRGSIAYVPCVVPDPAG
jgi:hypothetical protein